MTILLLFVQSALLFISRLTFRLDADLSEIQCIRKYKTCKIVIVGKAKESSTLGAKLLCETTDHQQGGLTKGLIHCPDLCHHSWMQIILSKQEKRTCFHEANLKGQFQSFVCFHCAKVGIKECWPSSSFYCLIQPHIQEAEGSAEISGLAGSMGWAVWGSTRPSAWSCSWVTTSSRLWKRDLESCQV